MPIDQSITEMNANNKTGELLNNPEPTKSQLDQPTLAHILKNHKNEPNEDVPDNYEMEHAKQLKHIFIPIITRSGRATKLSEKAKKFLNNTANEIGDWIAVEKEEPENLKRNQTFTLVKIPLSQ
ncbi:hypothetical protein HK096_008198 [Nowakowskiella sp. JEL0078]|nr:hypothetical protein HK096_008198 [Nowakowskiella sp. JEL0078]